MIELDIADLPQIVQINIENLRRHLIGSAPKFMEHLSKTLVTIATTGLLAHAAKPYGQGTIRTDLGGILAAPTLDCTNYPLLAYHLARTAVPDILDRAAFHFIGWKSATIGNEQTLFAFEFDRQLEGLMLDPTAGILAKGTFDAIASGRPLSGDDIVAWRQQPQVDFARENMITALLDGLLRPSEVLYYFENFDRRTIEYGSPNEWATPGAVMASKISTLRCPLI